MNNLSITFNNKIADYLEFPYFLVQFSYKLLYIFFWGKILFDTLNKKK